MIKNLILIVFLLCNLVLTNEHIVRIIGTANVHGEIDPCGWKKKPLGGLARKATKLDELKSDIDELFIVDAGNLFFKSKIVDPGIPTEIAVINADIIVESFNKMGCTAFSPGVNDFAAGKDFLLSLEKKSDFQFISSNIYDLNNNLLFKPYVIKQYDGLNIAFIGLTSLFESSEIDIHDPIVALKYILDEVIPISDIRILLFSSIDEDMNIIQKENLDLTMVLRSKNKKRSSDGGGEIPAFSMGDRGRYIYKYDLLIEDIYMPFIDVGWCQRTIRESNQRLNKMKQGDMMVDLEVLYKDNPSTLNRVHRYQSQIEEANQRLENVINSIEIEKFDMGKTINDRIDILKIVDKGKIKIKEITSLHPNYSVPHDHDSDGIPDH